MFASLPPPTYNGLHWQGLSIWFGRRRAIAASNSTLFLEHVFIASFDVEASKPIKEYLTLKLNVAQFDLFYFIWDFFSIVDWFWKFLKKFQYNFKVNTQIQMRTSKGLLNLQLLDNKTLLKGPFYIQRWCHHSSTYYSTFQIHDVDGYKCQSWTVRAKLLKQTKGYMYFEKRSPKEGQKRGLKIVLVLRIPFLNIFLAESSYVSFYIPRQNQDYFLQHMVRGRQKKSL